MGVSSIDSQVARAITKGSILKNTSYSKEWELSESKQGTDVHTVSSTKAHTTVIGHTRANAQQNHQTYKPYKKNSTNLMPLIRLKNPVNLLNIKRPLGAMHVHSLPLIYRSNTNSLLASRWFKPEIFCRREEELVSLLKLCLTLHKHWDKSQAAHVGSVSFPSF